MSADTLDCPECELELIVAEGGEGEPTVAYCPDCGHEEVVSI